MTYIGLYILDDDDQPKPVDDTLQWGRWFGDSYDKRRLAYYERDGHWVSTVFLGIDHNFGRRGPPVLYETMVFDDVREIREGFWFGRLYRTHGDEQACERYSTRDDAMIGHERHVKQLDNMLDAARDFTDSLTAAKREKT